MQLPEIPDKIPVKKRKILGPIARLLLSKHNWSIVGKFPNRKKMILIGAPHTSHRDTWFGLLVVLSLDLRVNFFGAKWMFSRLPSPITFKKSGSTGYAMAAGLVAKIYAYTTWRHTSLSRRKQRYD